MTAALSVLADRHMRQDPSGYLASADHVQAGTVRVVVQPDIASTYAGQHMAWLLVNLLARQFQVVRYIVIDAPDVPVLEGVTAFGTTTTLAASLSECIQLVADAHITVVQQADVDITLVVGPHPHTGQTLKSWYLHADGWRWYVGVSPLVDWAAPHGRTAIGPHLAACFAAGEAFKHLRGLNEERGRYIDAMFGSGWSMETALSWNELRDGPDTSGLEVPHAYFAGAGAVAQACMLALGASGVRGRVTAIDHDVLDLTNSNRYVLATQLDDEESKVEIACRYFERTDIQCKPAPAKWDAFVAQPKPEWSYPDLDEARRAFYFPIVLSCVDKNRPRHDIQNARPGLIIGGSTDGLTARAELFDPTRNTGCLKCFNPPEKTIEVANATIEKARTATEDERMALCHELGIPREELQRILEASGCGALTPADIERFGTGPVQMSVGFVSAAAGVLQAAQFIRSQVYDPVGEVFNQAAVFAAFGTGRLSTVRMAPDLQCACQQQRNCIHSGPR